MDPYIFAKTTALNLNVSIRIDTLDGSLSIPPYTTLLQNSHLKHVGSNALFSSPTALSIIAAAPRSTATFSGYGGTRPAMAADYAVTVQLFADSKPLTGVVQTSYKYLLGGPAKNSSGAGVFGGSNGTRRWGEWLSLPICYCEVPISAQLAITVWEVAGAEKDGEEKLDEDKGWSNGRSPFGGTTIRLFKKDGTLKKGRQKCKLWLGQEADGLSDTKTSSDFESTDEVDRLEKLLKKQEMGEIPRTDWLDNMVFRAAERIVASQKRDEVFLLVDFPKFDTPFVFEDFEYPQPAPKLSTQLPPPVAEAPGIRRDSSKPVMVIYDPEAKLDNPCELKHRRLVRSHRNGPLDRELKPNAKIRDELNEIIKYPPTQELDSGQKDLLWKFRYYLTRDKRALTKFLKSVSWNDLSEVKQAVQLLPTWTEIEVDDALELLGPQFEHPAVRSYAVNRLKKADDEELQMYLLQLVQALKFERISGDATKDSSLASFLISRASANAILGNFFHWYLMVECEDKAHKPLFAKIAYDFQVALQKMPDGDKKRAMLKRQADFVFMLSEFSKQLREARDDRPKKIEKLKQYLADPRNDLASFEPMPLPLDPTVIITGCYPEESSVFKSSLSPLLIHLKTTDPNKPQYPVIFKAGDDLRQDQLVIQIVILMDKLLRKENLDLKLTPYRILATSVYTGVVQFIPSITLAGILQSHSSSGGVLGYLRAHNPDDSADLGVKPEVMDTYVKSCAGYCVVTYLLGVGDRHLDNLLLTTDGHFFHADFGFILGRDPKPFAPAMKLCKEMVDGMGGSTSPHFTKFKNYCYTAYTTLRKSSNLILNLFALMVESDIPDIRSEPDKAVLKVQECFHMEMTDEEAIRWFQGLIMESMNSLFPIVIDKIHGLAQMWRR